MLQTPYGDWVRFVQAVFGKFGKKPKLVLELGCGTGSVTTRLAAKGYDMIGLDRSAEMLAVAAGKQGKDKILYICQDMRRFELYGTVDCVLCLCDGMNYITDADDMQQVFGLVKNYLNPGGLFVFDLNTQYKFEQMAGKTYWRKTKGAAYSWDNYYDKRRRVHKYVAVFRADSKDGEWHKETHYQRGYNVNEIRQFAKTAGFSKGYVYDMDEPVVNGWPVFKQPVKTTQRVCYVMEC